MNVYHYHPTTGVYLETSVAHPDPAEWQAARDAVVMPMLSAAADAYDQEIADAGEDEEAQAAAASRYDQARAAAVAAGQAVACPRWLIPAHATEVAPPETAEGEVAIMTAEGWIVGVAPEVELPDDEPDAAAVARAQRDAQIARVRWIIDRHRDQVELGLPTTLSAEEHLAVLTYVQGLRDVPQQPDFPTTIQWPAPPAGLDLF